VESKKDWAAHRPGLAFLEQIDIFRCREGANHLPNLANLKDNEIWQFTQVPLYLWTAWSLNKMNVARKFTNPGARKWQVSACKVRSLDNHTRLLVVAANSIVFSTSNLKVTQRPLTSFACIVYITHRCSPVWHACDQHRVFHNFNYRGRLGCWV
jgi:hypothetical protein